MLCLDNSVLARFARPDADPAVVSYLKSHASESWSVPATVVFEYLSYYETPAAVRRQRNTLLDTFEEILPLTTDVAVEATLLQQSLTQQNVTLDVADLLHVATARNAGATFVTCDAADFDIPPIRQLLDVDIVGN